MANVTEIGQLPKSAVDRVCSLEKIVQKNNPESKPVFRHCNSKELVNFDKYHKKYETNTLGLDLGCINQYGLCE